MADIHLFIDNEILTASNGICSRDDPRNVPTPMACSTTVTFEQTTMGTVATLLINTNLSQGIAQVRDYFAERRLQHETAESVTLEVHRREHEDPYFQTPLFVITDNKNGLLLHDNAKGITFTFSNSTETDLHTLCKSAIYANPEQGRQPLVLFYKHDGNIALRQFFLEGSYESFPSTTEIVSSMNALFFDSYAELTSGNLDFVQNTLEFGFCVPFQTQLDAALLTMLSVKRIPAAESQQMGIPMKDLPGMPEGLHPDAKLPPGTRMAPDAMKAGMGLPDGIKLDDQGNPIIPEGVAAPEEPSGQIPPGMPPGFRLPPGTRMAPDAMKNMGMGGLPEGIRLDANGMPVQDTPKFNNLGMPLMPEKTIDVKDRLAARDIHDVVDVEVKPNKPLKPTVI